MSKSHRSLCVLFSRTGAGLCIYHLFVWSNLNFLHISQWITLPTQSCLIIYYFRVFHISVSWWLFRWSLSDSKSPQVSRTRLRILADLSNAVIWIVSTRPPTSKSSRPFNNPLVIVPKAPITIGTIVTFMFHRFFNSLARSMYLSFFSHPFRFIQWSARTAKSIVLKVLFFFFFFFFADYYKGWSSCLD